MVNQDWCDLGISNLASKCKVKQQWNWCLRIWKHGKLYWTVVGISPGNWQSAGSHICWFVGHP